MNLPPQYNWITYTLPGIEGAYKTQLEDFVVEEVPAYLPSGEGEHVYLWLEKVDVSASYLKRLLKNELGVEPRDVGMAGMKDRHGRTRQWISVPERSLTREVSSLVGALTPQVHILEVSRHQNKLKIGHLEGNRFELILRNLPNLAQDELERRIEDKITLLKQTGMPNYYGPQRFGHDGQTLKLGLGWLEGQAEARKTLRRNRSLKKLAINAVQSAHFNQVLAMRIEQQTVHSILPGDVLNLSGSNSVFVAQPDDLPSLAPRLITRDIALTGPMAGAKMMRPAQEASLVEQAAWDALGLSASTYQRLMSEVSGVRRPLTIGLDSIQWQLHPGQDGYLLQLNFFLPAGSYATILCEELFCST